MRIPFSHPHQHMLFVLFLMIGIMIKVRQYLIVVFHFLFRKNIYSFLSLISKSSFFWMLSCMSYLYRLCINPLLVISFANIFSNSGDCLSFCQCLPLLWKSFLSSIQSHLFIAFTLGDRSKKIFLWFML